MGVGLGGLCAGQADAHERAAAGGGLGADGAALLVYDLADDRKAEARAGTSARVGAAVEAVEDVRELVGGDPGAVVADVSSPPLRRDLDRLPGAILERVVEQVGDGALQARGDAADERRLCEQLDRARRRPAASARRRPRR